MSTKSSKTFTDEERVALATKLDAELDEFINGLEKKRYSEGWPEDRWQEEMDKHPFFMKTAPKEGEELHPLLEGIQQLKYDPNENSAEELALKYKDDGNFYMKHKKFRIAIMCFTEGIKVKCNNHEYNAALYNNRSAAHFFLKNYRSSLNDAQTALKLKQDYSKARWRAARCAFHLNEFDLCLRLIDEILNQNPKDEEALKLQINVNNKKKEYARNLRKAEINEKKKQTAFKRTVDKLHDRNIKFDDLSFGRDITEEFLKPTYLPVEDHPVHIDEHGTLVWPAAFSYPEFSISDYNQKLREDVIMEDCINDMFEEPLSYDKKNEYRPGDLSCYYENRRNGTVHKINQKKSIGQIIDENNFYVHDGCLLFYVVPTGSEAEKQFIQQPRKVMP